MTDDTIHIHESTELIEMVEIGSHERVDCTTIDLAIVREAIEQLVAYVAVEPESADQLADRGEDRISPFGIHTILERLIEILVAARMAQTPKQEEEDTTMSRITYDVAPHPSSASDRTRYFLTEGAAVQFAGEQAAMSFTTPQWLVQVTERDKQTRISHVKEYLFVNPEGVVEVRTNPKGNGDSGAPTFTVSDTAEPSDPLEAERAKVAQAMALLREAREGVDAYGAWAQADTLHDVINDVETQITALLDQAVALIPSADIDWHATLNAMLDKAGAEYGTSTVMQWVLEWEQGREEDRVESSIAAEEQRIAADPDVPSGF